MNMQWALYSALCNMVDANLDDEVKEKIQHLITIKDIEKMSKKEMEAALIDVFKTHANLHKK